MLHSVRTLRSGSTAGTLRIATAVALAVLAFGALAAPAAVAAPADPTVPEVVADTFSIADLARAARQVPAGGRLFVSGVSLEPGAPAEALELEQFRVVGPNARIVVHGDDGEREIPFPDHAFFRGQVAGDPASLAVLSVRESGEVRGVVQRQGRIWLLGRDREGGDGVAVGGSRAGDEAGPQPLVAREATAAGSEPQEPFTCGQGDLPPVPEDPLSPAGTFTNAPLTTVPHTALVALETDWEFFQKFGNVDDATAYVLELFAYASSIYDQEINTSLQVGYLSLWTTSSDPWGQGSVSCGFYEFGQYWNDNRTDVDRTIAHFLSGKNNGGGIAWVGVLCNGPFNVNLGTSCPGLSPAIDSYGGDYGYSGDLDGNFNADNPNIVWDWIVVTHEIGHNFNSPHSHCYNGLEGSPDPVDECFSGDFRGNVACYSGPTSLPCGTAGAGCGTIMSYCHFQGGGLANIAPSFGTGHPHGTLPQRIPDRMRAHVEAEAAINPSCLARLGCYSLTLGHTGTGSDPVAAPLASVGCPLGSYDAGEVVTVTAAPTVGWSVDSWSGTDDDASGFVQNTVTMPAANHAVTANYQAGCTDITLTSGTDNGTVLHDACGTLTAGTTYRVGSTGDVSLRSYQKVVLTDGFRVEGNGSLKVVVPVP